MVKVASSCGSMDSSLMHYSCVRGQSAEKSTHDTIHAFLNQAVINYGRSPCQLPPGVRDEKQSSAWARFLTRGDDAANGLSCERKPMILVRGSLGGPRQRGTGWANSPSISTWRISAGSRSWEVGRIRGLLGRAWWLHRSATKRG